MARKAPVLAVRLKPRRKRSPVPSPVPTRRVGQFSWIHRATLTRSGLERLEATLELRSKDNKVKFHQIIEEEELTGQAGTIKVVTGAAPRRGEVHGHGRPRALGGDLGRA